MADDEDGSGSGGDDRDIEVTWVAELDNKLDHLEDKNYTYHMWIHAKYFTPIPTSHLSPKSWGMYYHLCFTDKENWGQVTHMSKAT